MKVKLWRSAKKIRWNSTFKYQTKKINHKYQVWSSAHNGDFIRSPIMNQRYQLWPCQSLKQDGESLRLQVSMEIFCCNHFHLFNLMTIVYNHSTSNGYNNRNPMGWQKKFLTLMRHKHHTYEIIRPRLSVIAILDIDIIARIVDSYYTSNCGAYMNKLQCTGLIERVSLWWLYIG